MEIKFQEYLIMDVFDMILILVLCMKCYICRLILNNYIMQLYGIIFDMVEYILVVKNIINII